MLKAKCIRYCDTYSGVKGASTKSCCGSSFDVDNCYTLDMIGGIDINSHGEVEMYFSASVFDGSHDGYDNACGINFQSTEWFNHYFQIVDSEENNG